jgi:1,4-alpha-glucan branching enzyme
MHELAQKYGETNGLLRRALNQMARELLLAESSDWAFMMKTGTTVEYAVKRTREHLLTFFRLEDSIRKGEIDEAWVGELEHKDCIFPGIDYRVYS